MAITPDPRVDLARTRTMTEVVDKLPLEGLHRVGVELIGPCPSCGGRDRFSINLKKGVFNCRHCGAGDPLALVQLVCDCDFMGAVEHLEGGREIEVDPAEIERRQKARAQEDAKAEADQEKYRAYAKRRAVEIWRSAQPFWGSPAEAYLAARRVGLRSLPYGFACFRFLPAHPYVKRIVGENRTLHEGPALISAVQGPDGRFAAVHQTWINPADPGTKARICHPLTGKDMPPKMVQGSKKGGAIRLTGTVCMSTLVMGEGIETTGSALVTDAECGASYWAGIDLGNMSGKQTARNSGLPDLTDDRAFLPPSNVSRLIFIQDGDSEEKMTRAKLTAGLRRAMHTRPELSAQIVRAGDGVDLNDIHTGDRK
jgi:hypothetical protein